MIAFLLDMFLLVTPVNLLLMAIFGAEAFDDPGAHPLVGLLQLGVLVVLYGGFWTRTGQTPGKKAMRLKVVGLDGGLLPPWQAGVRFLAYFLSFLSVVGFLLPLMRRDRRALHDLIAGSLVARVP